MYNRRLTHLVPLFVATLLVSPSIAARPPMSKRHIRKNTSHKKKTIDRSPKGRLSREVSVALEEYTLDDMVDWLRNASGLNVVVRWRALNRVGVYHDDELRLTLKDASISQIVTESLRQLSDDLRWRAVGNTITISTMEDFAKDLYTVVYDIRGLLQDNPDYIPPPTLDAFFGCHAFEEESHFTREQLMDMMADAIISNVLPETWREHGGEGSISIIESQMKLIIRNCPEVHMTLSDDFTIPDSIPSVRTTEMPPERSSLPPSRRP